MVWEVDEDCDGSINYAEFQAMWARCREDKAGACGTAPPGGGWQALCRRVGGTGVQVQLRPRWRPRLALWRPPATRPLDGAVTGATQCMHAGTEPRGLYNVVLFLLHDRGGRGRVALEEAMKITYLRVGKVRGWRCAAAAALAAGGGEASCGCCWMSLPQLALYCISP